MTDTKLNFNIGTVNAWFPVSVNRKILRDAKRRNRQRRLEKVKANWKLAASVYNLCGRGFVKKAKSMSRFADLQYRRLVVGLPPRAYYSLPDDRFDCVGLIRGMLWGTQGGDANDR